MLIKFTQIRKTGLIVGNILAGLGLQLSLFFGLLFGTIGISAPMSQASAMVTISGKLKSITDSQYVVEYGKALYYVNRTQIPKRIADKIEKTEIDVTFLVPMGAIERVRPLTK